MTSRNERGPARVTSTANLRRVDGSPLRVLVVDDEELLAEAVSLAFEADGWDVRTLNRGREVLFAAREFAPDVIILDIMMPDLDGYDVLARVRNDREETRVLFLTAKDSQEDRLVGLRARAATTTSRNRSASPNSSRGHEASPAVPPA